MNRDKNNRRDSHSLLGIVAITLLGIVYRVAFLDEPYRCDEAYTYLNYASKPISEILVSYNFPNNHIFHSILVHFTTRWLGFTSFGLRLPVLLAGILLILGVAMSAYQITTDYRIALLSAFFVAVSPYMIFYSVNARGYMIQSFLAIVVMNGYFYRPFRLSTYFLVPFLGVTLALILLTVPSGVVVCVPFILYLFMMAGRPEHPSVRTVVSAVFILGLIALGVSLPILSELLAEAHGAVGPRVPIISGFKETYSSLCVGLLPKVFFAFFALLGFLKLPKSLLHFRLLFLTFVIWPFLGLLFQRPLFILMTRCYLPLFSFMYILTAIGIFFAYDLVRSYGKWAWPLLGCVVLAAAFFEIRTAVQINNNRALLFFPERPTAIAVRTLTRWVVPRIVPGERIEGTDFTSDVTAAAYTVESLGFRGVYGIPFIYKAHIKDIYLVGESKGSVAAFFIANLDSRFWSNPMFVAGTSGGVAYQTRRLRPNDLVPADVHGYHD